ncbi:MAG TPA: NADH-quinone oxidoreductase subunit C [Solirubrobacteraceae bacterium]|nr:NADH-quinone oxidoreductase subunit C [Solirubrobacteraceae bacterium]
MLDRTALEALAQGLRDAEPSSVLGTTFDRGRAEIQIDPSRNVEVIEWLREQGFTFLASLHGVDYLPEEPRLGVIYELLDMTEVRRVAVKARVSVEDPKIRTVVHIWPGADFPERELYDMFGVVFDGHPDLRRILMPEDYEGFPQRRDFPVGGEPILFTYNETEHYGRDR